ncbi:MAG: hypothetical protein A4E48_01974 [Methanosaeta sp. PtaU1.Bin060]|nr:MAG: hypothetical protein A4E48_01974 [Methanosaeta sp. PtaU1.Bin060]
MLIRDIFETKIEERIEPTIKVSERQDEHKLADEIGSYVVTPTIEKFLDDFLEHYTETFFNPTSEIGVWISGYFGSGKSHLAKIASLLIENRSLEGIPVIERFEIRLPYSSSRRDSILRSLFRVSQCNTQVLAFNINTLEDSKTTPLPKLLLSQFYQSKGYSSNFIYARVIEAELDKQGKLEDLHASAEKYSKKPWVQMRKNLSYYASALYKAACDVAPDIFETPVEVSQALKNAENGELYNIQFLVGVILDDLNEQEKKLGKPCRLVLILDESGQWIGEDGTKLAQLQALVEESAIAAKGKIWIVVTTHEDMGSVYQNARALKGDMKKIEGRFFRKISLTTENIELVLEDRIFKKKLAGREEVAKVYNENPGALRGIGELANTSQKLPECSEGGFVTFYPFLPYQIHLIPEIVKGLRSAGGRGEQISGSTRTLLAITQDILRSGRRRYLDSAVGELVSFDEVYNNLAGEAEVNPETRKDLSQIETRVKEATNLTRRVAEVLYLIRGINYIPRTPDNISRLLVEHSTDNLPEIYNHIMPELKKLIDAKLVAKIGEEYEFLTPEEQNFEKDVADEKAPYKMQDLEAGLSKLEIRQILGLDRVQYRDGDFPVRVYFDETPITKDGFVQIQIFSPLSGVKLRELEERSLGREEQQTIFVLSAKSSTFQEILAYYIAVGNVVQRWKGDPHKSEEAHKIASERESKDLGKLREKVVEGLREGLKGANIVFQGSSRSLIVKNGQSPGVALESEISALYWPTLYPKYLLFKVINEHKAIPEVLNGSKSLSPDIKKLGIYDKIGQIDPHSPLIDGICSYISFRQSRNERILGADLIEEFSSPPYGWNPSAVRIGVAALVRAGSIIISINKKPFTNPADQELQNALRRSVDFNKVQLALDEVESPPLDEVRELLIRLTRMRKIDETPAALSEAMEEFASELLSKADEVIRWSQPAGLSLPRSFHSGKERFEKIVALKSPNHRVHEIYALKGNLEVDAAIIRAAITFVSKMAEEFIEMRNFASSLGSVENRLPKEGTCRSFLANWRATIKDANMVEEENWKILQGNKLSATSELEQILTLWRGDARRRAKEALERLPKDLEINGLKPDLVTELSKPLEEFINGIDKIKDIIQVSTLPDSSSSHIRELGEAIQRKKEDLQKVKVPKLTAKKVRHLNVTDVVTTGRIRDINQWEQVKGLLDQAVRKELEEGNEVELI